MNYISKTYAMEYTFDFDDKYQFSKNGMCFNVKTGREIRQSYCGGSIGYYINGKFMSLTKLIKHLVKIKNIEYPF